MPNDFVAQGGERRIVTRLQPTRTRSVELHSDSGALHGCIFNAAGTAIDNCQDRDCNPSRTLENPTSIPCLPFWKCGPGFVPSWPPRGRLRSSGRSWYRLERDDVLPGSLRYGAQVVMTKQRSSGSDSHTPQAGNTELPATKSPRVSKPWQLSSTTPWYTWLCAWWPASLR